MIQFQISNVLLVISLACFFNRVPISDSFFHSDNLSAQVLHIFQNDFKNISFASDKSDVTACEEQIQGLLHSAKQLKKWSVNLFDSWGKLPSGITYGHYMELGNFEECLNIKHELSANSTLYGKYCLVDVPIGKLQSFNDRVSDMILQIGVCMPKICNSNEIDYYLKSWTKLFLKTQNESVAFEVTWVKNCEYERTTEFEILDWIAIGLFSTIILLAFLGTVYDYMKNASMKVNNVLMSFSMRANWNKLFRIERRNSTAHIILCLDGIRCLSIIWVIIYHSYWYMFQSPNINNSDIPKWMRTPYAMVFLNGIFSVDTFFFLSGLLVATTVLRKLEKAEDNINIAKMYMHRYLRLTPVLAVAVLITMSLYRYVGKGPLLWRFNQIFRSCRKTWWATLLYVQNYAAAKEMCFGHSWYLAVDMQLFLMSPFLLIALRRWKGWTVVGLVVLVVLMCLGVTYVFIANSFSSLTFSGEISEEMMAKTYYATHMRAIPWFIGFIFGYYFHTNKNQGAVLVEQMIGYAWVIGLALMLSVIFIFYPRFHNGNFSLSALESGLHMSIGRVVWSIGLICIIHSCSNGAGGPVKAFLSWGIWQPMAKLSYCMYILHMIVNTINAGRVMSNTYVSDYDGIMRFWDDYSMTFIVSVLVYLLVEAPLAGIEKIIFGAI